MADPQIPPPAAGGPLILLKAKTYALIRQGLMRAIRPSTEDFEIERSVAELKFRLRPSRRQVIVPLQVDLFEENESGIYYVTMQDGCVNERVPGGEDSALIAHEVPDLKLGEDAVAEDGEEASDRRRFYLAVGQQLSVIVEVDEHGAIAAAASDPPVRAEVESADEESIHYIPKIGDATAGVAGSYHYKICTLEAPEVSGGPPVLKRWLAGSHISHFREIPKVVNLPEGSTTDVARVIKEYHKPSNEIRFRSLSKGDGQLRVHEEGDHMVARGNGKNFVLRYQVEGSSAEDAATFEDGLITDEGSVTIPIPTAGSAGWWGTVWWQHFNEYGVGDPQSEVKLLVENGRIMGVETREWGGSTLDAVDGTEADPGSAFFTSIRLDP